MDLIVSGRKNGITKMKKLLISLLSLGLFSSSAIAYDPYRPRLYEPPSYSHVPPAYRYQRPYPPYPPQHPPYYVERRRKNDVGKAIAIGAAALMLGIIINEAARR